MAFTIPSVLRSAGEYEVNQWEFMIDQSRELTILSRLRSPMRVFEMVMVITGEDAVFPALSVAVAEREWMPLLTPWVFQMPV